MRAKDWFHGVIGAEEAESRLRKDWKPGIFLARQTPFNASSSNSRDVSIKHYPLNDFQLLFVFRYFLKISQSREKGSLQEECIITKENRSFCGACRLKKCLDVGFVVANKKNSESNNNVNMRDERDVNDNQLS